MELHDLAQHRFSHSRELAGLAILQNRRRRDAGHDEQTSRNGAFSLAPRRQRIAVSMIGAMISSTLLTLIVIPAIFGLIKSFRLLGGLPGLDLDAATRDHTTASSTWN